MNSNTFHISELVQKHLQNRITESEQQELQQWITASAQNRDTFQELTNEEWVLTELKKFNSYDMQTGRQKINNFFPQITPIAHRVHFLKTAWFRYAAAVIILAATSATIYLLNNQSDDSPKSSESMVQTDIVPGTNRAVLTVGNKTIDLSSNKTGIRVGNSIRYTDGEKIADAGQQLLLTTPKGGQYQAVLPDGSKVWLNAASSVKFPSKFTGDTREVEITGEVYLEIVKNSRQPFYVTTGKTTIHVLGTSFNVNAYSDESSIKTTLVEGSVKVKIGERESLLKPGQQAKITDEITVSDKVDIDAVMAWKNGRFQFEGAGIEEVMRQIARWYNLEVVYEGKTG
jgi:transmembrane sensor